MKEYPLGVLLSITTGRLLCDFSDMQECCEFLTGGPVWTHQFAFRPFVEELTGAVLAQHPRLESPELAFALGELIVMLESPEVKGQDDVWRLICAWLSKQEAIYGATLTLAPMADAPQHYQRAFTEPLKGKPTLFIEASTE